MTTPSCDSSCNKYTIDDALLDRINTIDSNCLKSTNLVNTNISNGLNNIDANVLKSSNLVNTNLSNGLCDTNKNIASAACNTQRDIYKTSQHAIDTLDSSMERKSIANDLHGFNNTHALLGSIDKNGERGISSTERNGASNLVSTMTASAQNLEAIERTNQQNLLATNTKGAEIMLSNERIILENHRLGRDMSNQHHNHNIETLKNICDIKSTINERYSKTEERQNDRHQRLELELARHNASTQLHASDNFSRLQLELCKLDNNLGKDIIKTSADAKFQSADYFRQTQLENAKLKGTVSKQHEQVLNNLCRMESKLELQAEKNTAAIQLEALRNRSDILCKIDKCCCEIKGEIKNSDSDKLRDRNLLLEFENIRQRNNGN